MLFQSLIELYNNIVTANFWSEFWVPMLIALISPLIIPLFFFLRSQWKKIRKKTRVLSLRYTRPIPKKNVKIFLEHISGPKKMKDMWIPTLFNKARNSNETLFAFMIYNSSQTENDSNFQLKVDFDYPCIQKIIIPSNRIEILEGGSAGSSFVSFHMKEILPNEKQAIKIITQYSCRVDIKQHSVRSEKCGNIPMSVFEIDWSDHNSTTQNTQ